LWVQFREPARSLLQQAFAVPAAGFNLPVAASGLAMRAGAGVPVAG
jgi:hypothetical protein